MVMSPDESQVMLFDSNTPYLAMYNVTSDSWLTRQNLPLSFAYGSNYTTAMDPASGIVFLGRGGGNGTMMMVYNATSHDSWTQPMPSSTQLPVYVQGYSFVYCASRKSILLFGGKTPSYLGNVYNPYVFEFQMGAYSWVRLAIDGTPIIYNLRTNQWTTTYSLAPADSKYNWGAIIGGIVAVVAVAAGVGFVYYRRRKQLKNRARRVDVQLTANAKQQQHRQQEQGSHDSQQQQRQQQYPDQQGPDSYHPRSHNVGTAPSVEQGSTYKGSLQHLIIDNGHMSASTTSFTPLFARDNSARYSSNSESSSIQQPPIELYEKGYYVPESSRRNPQLFDAAVIPYNDSGMVPVEVLSGEAPWMTPQSLRRNPQLVSEQLQVQEQQHHSLQRSGSVASGGTLVDDDDIEREVDAGREVPVYHEACSDARIESGCGSNGGGVSQAEATSITAVTTPADIKNTYHSPLQSAIHPTSTSSNIISATLVASSSQILDTATLMSANANESTDSTDRNSSDITKDEQALQQEMAMIEAKEAEYQQNLERLRLESERLELERLAYLDRLARIQNHQNI
ncbi:hypothetical protein BGZ91_012388 [Linnemannia elongata]|nr:hypothetical protein BGZ91_012388 [Linnemannia elongata]